MQLQREAEISETQTKHREIMKLLSDRILIQPSERKQQTASGIYLPSEAERKTEGTVIAIGPKVQAIKIGDYVRLFDHTGIEIEEGIIASESTDVEVVIN